MHGLMLANKDCKTCHGEGYYKQVHKGGSTMLPCGCLRPVEDIQNTKRLAQLLKHLIDQTTQIINIIDDLRDRI